MTIDTAVLIIGPAIAILTVLASRAADLYHWTSDLLKSGRATAIWDSFLHSPYGTLWDQPASKESPKKGHCIFLLIGG